MKKLITIALTAIASAAFATSTFAGDCGGCASGDKAKDKKEEKAES